MDFNKRQQKNNLRDLFNIMGAIDACDNLMSVDPDTYTSQQSDLMHNFKQKLSESLAPLLGNAKEAENEVIGVLLLDQAAEVDALLELEEIARSEKYKN